MSLVNGNILCTCVQAQDRKVKAVVIYDPKFKSQLDVK